MQNVIKLTIAIQECEALKKSLNALARLKGSVTTAQGLVKDNMALILTTKVGEGYVIPTKGSQEAKADGKTFRNVMFPVFATKLQKNYTDKESNLNKVFSSAWNALLVVDDEDPARAVDCWKVAKVLKVLNMNYKDITKIVTLLRSVKSDFDPKDEVRVSMFHEACRLAESDVKTEIENNILEMENKVKEEKVRLNNLHKEFEV